MIFTNASSEVFLSFLLNKVEAIVCSFQTQVKTESHNTKKQRCAPPLRKPPKSSSQALVKYSTEKDVLRSARANTSRPAKTLLLQKGRARRVPFGGSRKKNRKDKRAQRVPFRGFLEKIKIKPRTPKPVHAQYACGI